MVEAEEDFRSWEKGSAAVQGPETTVMVTARESFSKVSTTAERTVERGDWSRKALAHVGHSLSVLSSLGFML